MLEFGIGFAILCGYFAVCAAVALTVVLISSTPTVSYYFDLVGTIAVSIYLACSGTATLYNTLKKRGQSEDERERI